jgi:chromosome segregation ATPase
MDTDWQELEDVRKKFEVLDNELNAFFQSVKEIKEIRDSIGNLPDIIRQNGEAIEIQKKEIEDLRTSINNLLITFDEQAKGLFYDLERKTENLEGNVKASISELKDVFESNSSKLQNEQKDRIEQIAGAYEKIKSFFEQIKSIVDSHEQSINILNDNYASIQKLIQRAELSLKEIRYNISALQKRPHEVEDKVKAVEERLKAEFFTKLDKQKKVIMSMLIAFIISIISIVVYLTYWH